MVGRPTTRNRRLYSAELEVPRTILRIRPEIFDFEHKVRDHQALDDVRFVRRRSAAGEAAYNDESTTLTMRHVCKTS